MTEPKQLAEKEPTSKSRPGPIPEKIMQAGLRALRKAGEEARAEEEARRKQKESHE